METHKRKERSDGKETRDALLVAAIAEFSEKGYEGASTRSICARAGVNNALLNRYYGTKENLYRLVAKRHFGDLGEPLTKLAEGVKTAAEWQEAIRVWIDDFLYMTLPSATAQIQCAVLFREEVTHPTKFHDEFRRDFGRPIFEALRKLLAMAVDDEDEVLLWASSVWAQVSAYALADPVWHEDFRPKGMSNTDWSARIRDHICANLFKVLKFKKSK
ncbi:MAG: TetR/AcrR family transcriptional regulator [Kiritimatiellae bacterium]|nr:TetR/AcrR family transcriptional regulator [Kiritimatiellia bacterium]